MRYAYPQQPTSAIAALKRIDEAGAQSSGQSDLERKQDLAVVGQTVPLIFCAPYVPQGKTENVAGVWHSPKLLQIGIQEDQLSMMYLVSSGKVSTPSIDKVYWGYDRVRDIDSEAVFCTGYETLPPCVDLDYTPGGSLTWTTTTTSKGFSLPKGEQVKKWTSQTAKCTKISMTFEGTCEVTNSDLFTPGDPNATEIRGSASDKGVVYEIQGANGVNWNASEGYDYRAVYRYDTQSRGWAEVISFYESGDPDYNAKWYNPQQIFNRTITYTTRSSHRYKWEAKEAETGAVIKSGAFRVADGTPYSLTIDGLPANRYILEVTDDGADRNAKPGTYRPQISYDQYGLAKGSSLADTCRKAINHQNSVIDGWDDQFRDDVHGSEQVSFECGFVTETVFNEIEFPELPGGDNQITGGLSDLTVAGLKGNMLKLRPVDGPDYFKQLHMFIETGVEVERLLDASVGPSNLYPDLVLYLFVNGQVLKRRQVDIESLQMAAKMNLVYGLHFNGVLQTTSSMADWLTRVSPYFLCSPSQFDGKYGLAPISPLNEDGSFNTGAIAIDHVFDENHILSGSYQRNYIAAKDRRPICLVMVYRDQPRDSVGQTVTIEVRYTGTALSGPFEQHDLTEFCCTSTQAAYAARSILAQRRYVTHTCTVSVARSGRDVRPGQIVRLGFSLTDQNLNESSFEDVYRITSVREEANGVVHLEMTHFPLTDAGASVIAKEVVSGQVTIQ